MDKRVIIFAPHQDDEILGCAGTIDLLMKSNIEIFVVFATNGDFCGKESSKTRLQESIAALNVLGIQKDHIIVLGFADTGMAYKDSFLWKMYHSHGEETISSPISSNTYHPFDCEEYSKKKYGRHLPYTKNAFLHILKCLIEDINPDIIITSSSLDMHGDHAALCRFIENAIEEMEINIRIYQYIIHSGNDKEWPHRNSMYYTRPQNVTENLWKKRITVELDKSFDKKKLIELFQSQLSPSGYLLSFAKREEFFLDTNEVNSDEKDYIHFMEKI